MKPFTTNIIARSMEINIRRTRPTITRKAARTPQEGSDPDDTARWVSKTSFDYLLNFIFLFIETIRHLVFQNYLLSFYWLK